MLGEYKQQQQRERKTFLNIKEGAIVKRTDDGEQRYSYVEGAVEDIYTRKRTFRNEEVVYWYIDLRDETGELYSLGFSFRSNVFKSVVMSLATATNLDKVRIEPYTKNGYDKVVVYADGKKLDWIKKPLPPLDEVTVGGRTVKDDSKRMCFITDLVTEILGKQIIK